MDGARRIDQAILIRADAGRVWAVLTEPALVEQWLSDAGLRFTADWRVGGAMRSWGDWHGHHVGSKGEVTAWDPGRRLAYTHWSSLSQVPDTPEHYARIQLTLDEAGGGTRLSLAQENLLTYAIHGHWNFYWTIALDRIRRLAEASAISPDPAPGS